MGLKTSIRNIALHLKAKYYLHFQQKAFVGSRQWLIATEQKYGGFTTNVPMTKTSPKDPRSQSKIDQEGMTGGDRMLYHGYADKYSEYLSHFFNSSQKITLIECGILQGTGLAIWCDLFPDAHIIGLDIDLGHSKNNMENLNSLGAFKKNSPELYEFDQFADNSAYLETILKGEVISIFIDDGFHSIESILKTMQSVKPHLANHFVYFVEDNKEVHANIRDTYPDFFVDSHGELTIVTRRMSDG